MTCSGINRFIGDAMQIDWITMAGDKIRNECAGDYYEDTVGY